MTSNYGHRLTTLWRRTWHYGKSGSNETRIVHLNDRALNHSYRYTKNKTSTTKYNWFSFLPMALFIQYRISAYWYFTGMAVLSSLPFSPYGAETVVAPLVFVLAVGVAREFWEDLRRARGDAAVNSRPAKVLLDGEGIKTLQWKDLHVGDVVRVSDGEFFPADLLLLTSSGTDGVCYVETKNLDGETNLKVRHALERTSNLSESPGESSLRGFRADVQCEGPNASLYTFTGQIGMGEGQSLPLGPAQLLLRDSSLQNTGHIWGAVVYTGHDTKVMQNSTSPPSKRSRIDKSLDRVVLIMLVLLFAMSVGTGIASGYLTRQIGPEQWYLAPFVDDPYYDPNRAAIAGVVGGANSLVLYGYLIPIGLYISLEMVRVIQGFFMMLDSEMYEPSVEAGAKVRSLGLNEELGQVDTILSDKTGTLTCNQMDFFRCSIAGVSYGKGTTEVEKAAERLGIGRRGGGVEPDSSSEAEATDATAGRKFRVKGFNFTDSRLQGDNWSQEPNADIVRLFFQILAICHTAIPEVKGDDPQSAQYRAESPDEAALVVAAKQFGFCFFKRTSSAVYVRESVGQEAGSEYCDQTYEILSILEFNSTRKRMSVIVRFPDQRVMLLSKGADSVMMQRVDPANKRFSVSTSRQLKEFAEVGLRTLVVAYRELDEAQLQEWQAKYAEARCIIGRKREQKVDELADEIERNLQIVGGTGVEDKLQAGVPETIQKLAQAGINIWVLTGDKVETAINIGYSCGLLRKGMQKIIISLDGPNSREVEERAERENLSREDVHKELMYIVEQQLTSGNVEIGRSRPGQGVPGGDSAMGRSEGDPLSRELSQSRSDDHGNLIRRPSRGSGVDQELQEYKSGSRQESFSNDAKEQQNHQLDGLGSRSSNVMEERAANASAARDKEINEFALVIDGFSLALVLEEASLQEEFIRICKECVSILCCRMSPRQKAQVTKLVKKGMGENKLCLAIGDGANDVGMIQAANVGVGITGVEGAQAAMAADYAIGQFRFLERLLLVHGHWSYRRISLMVLYFFYKVCLLGWVSWCCSVFTFFSGQALYNDWYASFYDILFTSLPICVVGFMDQDVSAAECLSYPQLYRAGHRKDFINRRLITLWLLNSLYSGLLIFFVPLGLYWLAPFRVGGQTASVEEFGALLITCAVIVPNVQITVAIGYFTWIHHVIIWGSIASWYVFLLIYGEIDIGDDTGLSAYKVLIETLAPSPSYWLVQLLIIALALLPDFIFRCYKSVLYPSDHHIVVEISRRLRREHVE